MSNEQVFIHCMPQNKNERRRSELKQSIDADPAGQSGDMKSHGGQQYVREEVGKAGNGILTATLKKRPFRIKEGSQRDPLGKM